MKNQKQTRFNPSSRYIKQMTLSWHMMGGRITTLPPDTRRNSLYINSNIPGVSAYETVDHIICYGV